MKTGRSKAPASGGEAQNTRNRILDVAARLFYGQGYPTTGVNQIIAEAGAFKKSLYWHFPSKDDLALAYMDQQEAAILGPVAAIMRKSPRYARMVRAWMRVMRRGARSAYRHGCPLANFANQTHDDGRFVPRIRQCIQNMAALFEEYLTRAEFGGTRGMDRRTARGLTERMLLYYQGALQMYALSGEERYLHLLEKELLRLETEQLDR